MKQLASNANFVACSALSARQLEEKYDLELVLRFVLLTDIPDDKLGFDELGEFLTERMLQAATGEIPLDQKKAGSAFARVFQTLVDSGLVEDAFRKYDWKKGKFVGAFSISSYEAVSVGLGTRYSINVNQVAPGDLEGKVKDLWKNQHFLTNSGSGVRAGSRIPKTIPLGRKLMA